MSSVSHVADIFTVPYTSSTDHKPLPPIHLGPASDASDDRSLVVTDPMSRPRDQTPSPEARARSNDKSKGEGRFISHTKRRSMSVSDIDLQKLVIHNAPSSPAPTLPPKDGLAWESSTSLHGILSDFKGVLSQLDPDSGSSLDLRDPSTPTRRVAYTRPKTGDGQTPESTSVRSQRVDSSKSPVLPPVPPSTPTITLPTRTSLDFDATDSSSPKGKVEPIVPPRTSSLQTPSRSVSGAPPRVAALRHGSSPLRYKGYGNQMQSSYRDMTRLRVQHNSAASSSEPSLLSPGDDGRPCQQ